MTLSKELVLGSYVVQSQVAIIQSHVICWFEQSRVLCVKNRGFVGEDL